MSLKDKGPPQEKADQVTEKFGDAANQVADAAETVESKATGENTAEATSSDDKSAENQAAQKVPGDEGSAGTAADDSPQLLRSFEDIAFLNIAVIILLTYATIWLSKALLPRLANVVPSRFRLYPLGVIPIIRLVAMTAAIASILPLVFRITFENFLVIAGAASVAIGFAFKDYVSSLIAGIIAVFERPYRPGDWVKIGEHYGEVQSVGMRSIALVTASDDLITVPHSHLWSENISNSNNGSRTLMCVVDFYLHPDHDANQIRSRLRDVAITSAYLNYDRPVLVMLSDEPIGTHYKVKLYPFDLRDQFALISDVTVRGKEVIRDCGGQFITALQASGAT